MLDCCRVLFGKCSFKPDMLSCIMNNRSKEYATGKAMDISRTSGRQKYHSCFKTSFEYGVHMYFKTTLRTVYAYGSQATI